MTDQPFPATNLRPWLDQMKADIRAITAATASIDGPGITLHFADGETRFMPGDWTVHTDYETRPAAPSDPGYSDIVHSEVYTGRIHTTITLDTYAEDYPR